MAQNPSVADFTHALKGMDFPAGREELMDYAQRQGAQDYIMRAIENLPDGRFESMADVMKAYGEEGVAATGGRPQPGVNEAARKGGETSPRTGDRNER